MPEWILVVLALAGLSLLGHRLDAAALLALPLFAVAAASCPLEAVLAARRAAFGHHSWRGRANGAR